MSGQANGESIRMFCFFLLIDLISYVIPYPVGGKDVLSLLASLFEFFRLPTSAPVPLTSISVGMVSKIAGSNQQHRETEPNLWHLLRLKRRRKKVNLKLLAPSMPVNDFQWWRPPNLGSL